MRVEKLLLKILVFAAPLAVIAPRARAEYRVFELLITNTETNQSRVVVSTLDDIQYPGYYPLRKSETIAIQNTWMCWKRSDYYAKPCPNPRAPASVPDAARDQ